MPIFLSDEHVNNLISLLRNLQATSGLAPDLALLLTTLESNEDFLPSGVVPGLGTLTPPATPHGPITGSTTHLESTMAPLPSIENSLASALGSESTASPSQTTDAPMTQEDMSVNQAAPAPKKGGKKKGRKGRRTVVGGEGGAPAPAGGNADPVNWDPNCHLRGGDNVVAASVWQATATPAARAGRDAQAALSLLGQGCAASSSNNASTSNSAHSAWVSSMVSFVTADNWADEQRAFVDNSLSSLVKRCTRSIQLTVGLEFVTMVNFLQLATKVARYVSLSFLSLLLANF